MRRTLFTAAFTLAAVLGAAAPAIACPNCKEANAAGVADSDDPLAEARAWNRSIYLMLAVPYAMIGFGGFYCWKHLRNGPTIGV
jgi:hypothetical protein